MQVCTQLLFADGGKGTVAVTGLTGTVAYPGLSEADATFEFTSNGSHTFVAQYDPQQGLAWDLEYTAAYAGDTAPVTGTVKGIEQASYTLTLPDVGILAVQFDASHAFGTAGPSEIDVTVTYPDFDGHGTPFNETLKLPSKTPTGTIRSIGALPVDACYNWQARYVYGQDVADVSGPLNRASSAPRRSSRPPTASRRRTS